MRGFRRLGHISRILVKHGFGDFFDRLFKPPEPATAGQGKHQVPLKSGFPSPERVRRVLEELGPSFIKLGQLMSTRADIFPSEHIEELRKLQDSVPPVAYEEIRAVVEKDFAQPLADVFQSLVGQYSLVLVVRYLHFQ